VELFVHLVMAAALLKTATSSQTGTARLVQDWRWKELPEGENTVKLF